MAHHPLRDATNGLFPVVHFHQSWFNNAGGLSRGADRPVHRQAGPLVRAIKVDQPCTESCTLLNLHNLLWVF